MNVIPKQARWALLCVLCAAACLLPAWAAEAEPSEYFIAAEEQPLLFDDFSDDGDLFYGYMLRRAGVTDGASLLANAARAQLSAKDQAAYDALKSMAADVANGTRTNTVLTLTSPNFPKYWTASALGVDSIVVDSSITSEAVDALTAKMIGLFFDDVNTSPRLVFQAVKTDSPYEFYWFDGTHTYSYGLSASTYSVIYKDGEYQLYPVIEGFEEGDTVDVSYRFNLPVSADYGSGNTIDPALRVGVDAALAKAASIVSGHASEGDYDKLLSYATEICNLVDYNYPAFYDDSTPYGNPWQLIYVFDGDDDTKVVCEGYAKAFKYLCDLSSFQSPNVDCITVSGKLDGGAHMWNVVTMENGKSYLVDVTNSDNSHGPKYLFLKGGDPDTTDASQYTFQGIKFTYDADEMTRWGSLLTLDTADYELPVHVQIRGCSLTLVDEIALNFYLSFDETITADSGAYVTLTDFGTPDKQMISSAFTGTMDGVSGTVYRFTVSLLPKRMNDAITLACYSGNDKAYTMKDPHGTKVTSYDYCIADYLALAANQSALADLSAYMSAYGYYAQVNFDYDVSNAVAPSAATLAKINAVDAATLSAYAAVDTGSVTGLTPIGDNLTLNSEVTQRYIFNVAGSLSDYTFTVDGKAATPKAYNYGGTSVYCLEVPGIVAKNMDKAHTLTVSKGGETFTHQCSTLSYACKALTDSETTENLRNLVKAMYLYHTAAKAYFNDV